MNKKATLQVYHSRVMTVLDYIWQHLDKDLDVNQLAEIAHFSPYHFHRIYREMMHETVSGTVRRLRAHYASHALVQSNKSIEEIARQTNYTTAAAFIRAFSQTYGETPAAYRARRYAELMQLNHIIPNTKEYQTMHTIEIKNTEAVQLAGIRHNGSYMDIGQTFDKLFATAGMSGLLNEQTQSIGIYYDDPAATAVEKLKSDACITFPENSQLGEEFSIIQLEGGAHAVLTYKGPYSDLENVYEWFYGKWLPNSGYELANRPPFEEYLNDPKTLPPTEWLTAIHLPLAQ